MQNLRKTIPTTNDSTTNTKNPKRQSAAFGLTSQTKGGGPGISNMDAAYASTGDSNMDAPGEILDPDWGMPPYFSNGDLEEGWD